MNQQEGSSLTKVIQYLRQRLVAAREAKDRASLVDIVTTLDILRDAAWSIEDKGLATVLQDLMDAGQDTLSGVEWKGTIPTNADIQAALS